MKLIHSFKNVKLLLIAGLATFVSFVNGVTDLTTMSSCATCLNTLTNYICKDNIRDTASYCCPNGSTSTACKRNFCSGNALTTSMKFYACPYEPKMCGSTSQKLDA